MALFRDTPLQTLRKELLRRGPLSSTFAERRVISKFQNAIIDAMFEFSADDESVPGTVIHLAWINTATSSPLHTFLVDLYARCVPMAKCFDRNKE